MPQFKTTSQNRIFAVVAALLMLAVLFGGQMATKFEEVGFGAALGHTNPFVTAAYANNGANTGGGVNDLWGQVTVGEVGKELQNNGTDMGVVVTKAQDIAKTVTSLLTIVSFVSLLFWIARLALSAGNPQTRRVAVTGIWVSGVALTLFGGAWVVVSFFWNILSGVSTTGPIS